MNVPKCFIKMNLINYVFLALQIVTIVHRVRTSAYNANKITIWITNNYAFLLNNVNRAQAEQIKEFADLVHKASLLIKTMFANNVVLTAYNAIQQLTVYNAQTINIWLLTMTVKHHAQALNMPIQITLDAKTVLITVLNARTEWAYVLHAQANLVFLIPNVFSHALMGSMLMQITFAKVAHKVVHNAINRDALIV